MYIFFYCCVYFLYILDGGDNRLDSLIWNSLDRAEVKMAGRSYEEWDPVHKHYVATKHYLLVFFVYSGGNKNRYWVYAVWPASSRLALQRPNIGSKNVFSRKDV